MTPVTEGPVLVRVGSFDYECKRHTSADGTNRYFVRRGKTGPYFFADPRSWSARIDAAIFARNRLR